MATDVASQRYTAGRTPWGDPDLQGDYTNSNEYATPLERPERFAGKRLQDFTGVELEAIRGGAEQEAIDGLNRFCMARGLVSKPIPYDQLVASQFSNLWVA